MKNLLIVFCILMSFSSWAGNGWVSSGGEDLKHQHNPWFLKNVTDLKVCIDIDVQAFSPSSTKAIEILNLAFNYWKSEFGSRDPSLGIGTQTINFENQPCSGIEDIEFRLGYGTLNVEERLYLEINGQRPQDFVGLAIRKEYDPRQLRGRGIILLASDRGPERFQSGRGIPDAFWENDGLLLRTAIHELGHVFGLPHETKGIMGERYPEESLRRFKEGRSDLRLTNNIPRFFDVGSNFIMKPIEGGLFSIGGVWFAESLKVEKNLSSIKFENIPNSDPDNTLEAKIETSSRIRNLDFPVQVYLPEEQVVFRGAPAGTYLPGPSRVNEFLHLSLADYSADAFVQFNPSSADAIFTFMIGEEKTSTRLKWTMGD